MVATRNDFEEFLLTQGFGPDRAHHWASALERAAHAVTHEELEAALERQSAQILMVMREEFAKRDLEFELLKAMVTQLAEQRREDKAEAAALRREDKTEAAAIRQQDKTEAAAWRREAAEQRREDKEEAAALRREDKTEAAALRREDRDRERADRREQRALTLGLTGIVMGLTGGMIALMLRVFGAI